MALTSQADDDSGRYILESQIRECFGRVVYSHKTHKKCADACLRKLSRIKLAQIILSALTTSGLLGVLLGDPKTSKVAAAISAVLSTALLALNTYTKNNDPGQVAQ
jgi:SMODS and SLOG-associating 2TM effector domain family 4